MTVDPYILTFSALTVIATIWMGFWAARKSKTAHDFFVAGRNVSVGWNASAISGEYLSAASFMGVAGMVMSSGYDALWYPVCYACGYLFLLLFIAGPLRRFGAYTIPDFAEGRYDSPVFRKIAVIFVLFIGFFYTMPQMKGAGTTLAYIFPGLPYWAGVVLVGAVITLNVGLGGMKGITLVQAFQYWAKMFAISVPIFVLMAVYGHYGKQLGANSGSSKKSEKISSTEPLVSPNSTWSPQVEFIYNLRWSVSGHRDQSGPFNREFKRQFPPSADSASGASPPQLSYNWRGTDPWPHPRHFYAIPAPVTEITKVAGVPVEFTYPLSAFVSNAAASNVSGVALIGNNRVQLPNRVAGAIYPLRHRRHSQPGDSPGLNRELLPPRAPTDSTWLSPFGPLTTKAAKAAATALTNQEIRLRSDLPNQRMTVSINETNLQQALVIYSYLTGRQFTPIPTMQRLDHFLGYRLSGWHLVSPPAKVSMSYHNDGLSTAQEVKDRLESLFRSNGIAIIPEGNKYFRAVKIGDFANFGTTAVIQKAWLQTHERPLALLYTYSLIIALVCGTAGLPHILVRFYTNPNGVAAKRTTMWVMILIGVFYIFPPVFGVIGRNFLPELYSAVGAKGTDKVVLELPRILNERYAPLGSILSGITCAGAFAAFMSTFSGLLVSMTGALAHDVYGRMLRPQSTPDQRMKAFKICAVAVGAIAIFLGTRVEQFQINFMVGQAFAIAAASYFPLLFMSAWWRGMTMRGAATGMLTGGLLALGGITLTSFTDLKWLPLDAFWAAHPLLRILCEQPAIWAVPLAITLMIVVSKITQREIPSDVRMKMLVLHAPEKLGLKQEYIAEHQSAH